MLNLYKIYKKCGIMLKAVKSIHKWEVVFEHSEYLFIFVKINLDQRQDILSFVIMKNMIIDQESTTLEWPKWGRKNTAKQILNFILLSIYCKRGNRLEASVKYWICWRKFSALLHRFTWKKSI